MPTTNRKNLRNLSSVNANSYSYNRLRSKQAKPPSVPGQRFLTIIKEWGGALALIVAIFYTFPVGFLDRSNTNESKQIAESRQILADGGSMMVERIINISKISDPRSLEMINNMYNVKFFNLIYSNINTIKANSKYLRSSEIGTFAGLLSFSGLIAESLTYYDLSIKQAKDEKVPYVNVLRDKAQALLFPGPTQNIESARSAYKEVLDFYAALKHPQAPKQFAIFVSELAFAEATLGDWSCGELLRAKADNYFQLIRFKDPTIGQYYEWFLQNFANAKQVENQPANGCGYQIPEVKI